MKIIKINTALTLKSGIDIPSGAVLVINEAYLKTAQRTLIESEEAVFPIECVTLVYASQEALTSGKINITEIEEFNPVFNNLQVLVSDYETTNSETLFVNAVKNALGVLLGVENVEVIDAV